MKQLRFICAQPATKYYAWQVEVMINNFMEMGVNPNYIDVVVRKENGNIPNEWLKLANRYPARFFFYDDTRTITNYVSSVRPNILKQHFIQHPELKYDAIFYHDCDIIFTKPVREWISQEMLDDDIWYGSDTRWYISHTYIKSKGDDIIQKMCEIMQMDEKIIEDNELNCIGAQYLMKNVDSNFWNRVESDCEKLFKEITELSNQKVEEDRHTMPPGTDRAPYHPLQIWCADMWAVLWGAWRLEYKTVCHPNYEFSWATSNLDDYNKMNIMHNAGVVSANDGLFYKANYMNGYPYNVDLKINENTGSLKYWEYVQKTAKISCLI
jgi:hypothetical protein